MWKSRPVGKKIKIKKLIPFFDYDNRLIITVEFHGNTHFSIKKSGIQGRAELSIHQRPVRLRLLLVLFHSVHGVRNVDKRTQIIVHFAQLPNTSNLIDFAFEHSEQNIFATPNTYFNATWTQNSNWSKYDKNKITHTHTHLHLLAVSYFF